MSSTAVATTATAGSVETRYAVIDTDVHPHYLLGTDSILGRLPRRWQEYVAQWGLSRPGQPGGDRPHQREFSHRWDTIPAEGEAPGSNPDFAREQLLDRYDFTAAILNQVGAHLFTGARSTPRALSEAMCTAINDDCEESWFAADPRWYASINAPYELPDVAVKEIQRRMDSPWSSRWRQLSMAPDNMNPPGHQKYFPIYEICQEYDIPIAMHVIGGHRLTASGSPNYYFEEHADWGSYSFPIVSSMIFDGVFDRFPRLKVALIELSWSWAVPLSWRLDASYALMRTEVPHLERKPSEYMRDHFWYSTQPMEEPEDPRHFQDVYDAFEATMGNRLMYSSDYPHWDFDEPSALSASLSVEQRRRILGGNASEMYGIPLKPGSGVVLP